MRLVLKKEETRMRKRLMSAALATAMALSVTACTSNPAESKTTAAPAETKAEADRNQQQLLQKKRRRQQLTAN